MDPPLRRLTDDELRSFDEQGVVLARGLLPGPWIDRMANAVDRVVANPTVMGRGVSMPDQGFSGDLFLWKTDDDFRDWVFHSPAALLAGQVLRSQRVRHFYDQIFVKPPGCHVPTPWHHDVTFWPVDVESRGLCSIWITFDAVSRESSGLEFVRGSHRWPGRYKAVTPNYDPYIQDSDFEDPPDVDAHRERYDLFCPDLEPGDCLIFDARVLHGSSGNHSTAVVRRAFSTRWVGEGVAYDPRPATMPLLWSHGLEAGDEIGGPLFPQVLPEPIPGECARREGGPEEPEPDLVRAYVEEVKRAAARRGAG